MASPKKLRDFPPAMLEALMETLVEKCPPPNGMIPILNDADRWELARQQGRHSVVDDIRGAINTMWKSRKKPQPVEEPE